MQAFIDFFPFFQNFFRALQLQLLQLFLEPSKTPKIVLYLYIYIYKYKISFDFFTYCILNCNNCNCNAFCTDLADTENFFVLLFGGVGGLL